MCISKLRRSYIRLVLIAVVGVSAGACDSTDDEVAASYAFVKPANIPEPTYLFENNPVTERGFDLGKQLFFDPLLSRDGTVSCNNCHQQATAFADGPQHPLSVGVDNRLGTRNAPSLANLAFMREFFWVRQLNTGGEIWFGQLGLDVYYKNVVVGVTYKDPLRQSMNSDKIADIEAQDRWMVSLIYNF